MTPLISRSARSRRALGLTASLGADKGRIAAALLLIGLAALQLSFGEIVWQPVRNLWFDTYQWVMARRVERLPAVIVDIDDDSLRQFGRWPWPRARLAQLLEATERLGALAIGLDMILPEADGQSPQGLLAARGDAPPELREPLSVLPSNDVLLAQRVRQLPVVLGRAALIDAPEMKSAKPAQTPVVEAGAPALPFAPGFNSQIVNLPVLEAAARGRGYLNDSRDGDGIVRTMPLVLNVNGALAPSLVVDLLRLASGQSVYSVRSDANGIVGVQIGTSLIPTDRDGKVRLYFSAAQPARRVSAAAVLRGGLPPRAFAHQVALVGVTAVGFSDVAATPLGARMDGVELHAQLVENILLGTRLIRPATALWWELFATLAFGAVLIIAMPRRKPTLGVILFGALAATLVAASFIGFQTLRVLYDPTLPVAVNALVVGLLLTVGFTVTLRRRRELDIELAAVRGEQMRAAGELRAAREIQMGMLPDPTSVSGLPANLDFFALLEPAQEVGGDLYDAFMLDPHRLFFMIGDVSGKGVPASLFMAITKTLCQSLARRPGGEPGELLSALNQEISRDNPTAMFVTAIVGIIDSRSGEVAIANAGHNPPILLHDSTPPKVLGDAGGPPLGLVENFTYPTERLRLVQSARLVLLTDGVTEAENSNQEHYGIERAINCLRGAPDDAAALCQTLHADVKKFAADAARSDDLTLVAVALRPV